MGGHCHLKLVEGVTAALVSHYKVQQPNAEWLAVNYDVLVELTTFIGRDTHP